MKYTAEEVRKSADWLYQWERKAGARNARAMLIAYAERIKADESAVPDGWVLVPVEPTEAMQTAHHIYGDTSDWWSAVIAAVPSAPEGESHE